MIRSLKKHFASKWIGDTVKVNIEKHLAEMLNECGEAMIEHTKKYSTKTNRKDAVDEMKKSIANIAAKMDFFVRNKIYLK